MNNNLGRFRLSVTDGDGARSPTRCRRWFAMHSAIPAEKRSPAQADDDLRALANDTVPDFKDANDKIEALWKEWPAGATSLVVQKRDEPRDTFLLKRGNFLKHGDEGGGRGARVPAPAPAGCRRQPADAGEVARRSGSRRRRRGRSSTASGRRTSAPGSSTRPRSSARRARSRATRSCSTGWRWSSWTSKPAWSSGHQAPPPPDRRRAPPIASRRGSRPSSWRRTRRTGCSRAGRASASMARSSATSPFRPAGS